MSYSGSALPPLPPHLDPRSRGLRHSSWKPAAKRIGLSVMAVVSVLCLVAAGYAWWTWKDVNKNLQRLAFNARSESTGPDIDGKDQNLLVVGNDDRSNLTNAQVKELHVGRDGGSLATDSMMIIHVPADGKKATLISLPRDSYVSIPGYGMNKLNSAYADGYEAASGSINAKRAAGAALLTKTISQLTGLTIDHFVQVTLLGFVLISDAIGGVEVDLCHAVDDTVAHNRSIGQDGGSGLVLSAGKHSIKGVQALEFVRQRHGLPNGDLDRAARQRYFLTQAFKSVVSAGTLFDPSKLNSLVSAVDHAIWVDSSLNLKDLALQMATLDPSNIVSKAIPFDGFEDTSVGSVEVIEPAQVKAFIDKLIHPSTSKPATSKPKSGSSSTSTAKKKSTKPSSCIN